MPGLGPLIIRGPPGGPLGLPGPNGGPLGPIARGPPGLGLLVPPGLANPDGAAGLTA